MKVFARGALLLLLSLMLLLSGCSMLTADPETKALTTETAEKAKAAPEITEAPQTGPIIEPQAIADYLFEHGELPDNFITKEEAQALGWGSGKKYVSDAAPGKSIGGDYFGNYEGLLPKGTKYHEADCNYTGGPRGEDRIIYSADGHVYYTDDHYNTFTELYPSKDGR